MKITSLKQEENVQRFEWYMTCLCIVDECKAILY